MPRIVVGPVIGKVSHETIRVLVELDKPCKNLIVYCQPIGKIVYDSQFSLGTSAGLQSVPTTNNVNSDFYLITPRNVRANVPNVIYDLDNTEEANLTSAEPTPRTATTTPRIMISNTLAADTTIRRNNSTLNASSSNLFGTIKSIVNAEEGNIPFAFTLKSLQPNVLYRIYFDKSQIDNAHECEAMMHTFSNSSQTMKIMGVASNVLHKRENTDLWQELCNYNSSVVMLSQPKSSPTTSPKSPSISPNLGPQNGGMRAINSAPGSLSASQLNLKSRKEDQLIIIGNSPDSSTMIDLIVHSGNQVKADEVFELAKDLMKRSKDQNVSDSEFEEMERQIIEMFRDLYREAWNHPSTKQLLSTVSNLMLISEHEIYSQFGLDPAFLDSSTDEFYIATIARRVYHEYQRQLWDDFSLENFQQTFFSHEGSAHVYEHGAIGLLFVDQKISKTFARDRDSPYLSKKQWDDIERFLFHADYFKDTQVLIVVSQSPLVLYKESDELAQKLVQLRENKDDWSFGKYEEERERFVRLLEKWKVSKNSRKEFINRQIFFIGGGDCKLGGLTTIYHNDIPIIEQICTGPCTDFPAPWFTKEALKKFNNNTEMEPLFVVNRSHMYKYQHREFTKERNICCLDLIFSNKSSDLLSLTNMRSNNDDTDEQDYTHDDTEMDIMTEGLITVKPSIILASKLVQQTEALKDASSRRATLTRAAGQTLKAVAAKLRSSSVAPTTQSPPATSRREGQASIDAESSSSSNSHTPLRGTDRVSTRDTAYPRSRNTSVLNSPSSEQLTENAPRTARRKKRNSLDPLDTISDLLEVQSKRSSLVLTENGTIVPGKNRSQSILSTPSKYDTVQDAKKSSQESIPTAMYDSTEGYEQQKMTQYTMRVAHQRFLDLSISAALFLTGFICLALVICLGCFFPTTIQWRQSVLFDPFRIVIFSLSVFPLCIWIGTIFQIGRSVHRESKAMQHWVKVFPHWNKIELKKMNSLITEDQEMPKPPLLYRGTPNKNFSKYFFMVAQIIIAVVTVVVWLLLLLFIVLCIIFVVVNFASPTTLNVPQ